MECRQPSLGGERKGLPALCSEEEQKVGVDPVNLQSI